MGHSVSKGRSARNEHLVRDIAYLREQTQKQEKALESLKEERDSLRARTTAQTTELENIKKENEELKTALQRANTKPSDTDATPEIQEPQLEHPVVKEDDFSDTDSGVNVEHCSYLKPGDKVLSLHVKWSYYTATIVHFDSQTLEYTINWDDGDPTGRVQRYSDVARDQTPGDDQVAIGTLVLFPQGEYSGTEGNNSGGIRYHQGRITRVYTDNNGTKRYDGVHTKGENDGKWVTYKDYSYIFKGLYLKYLRVSPNIYDILNAETQNERSGTTQSVVQQTADIAELQYDVFMSYCKLNSNIALDNGEVSADDLLGKTNEEYKALNGEATDPRWIKQELVKKGVRVWMNESRNQVELSEMVNIMKQCKVIIACISNEYANGDNTRMELQFTKKTIKKPILPVVVGGGTWEWQMTVVGLLIAGELYIDFTHSDVATAKTRQLMEALDKHITVNNTAIDSSPSRGLETKAPEVFISYCWTNSFLAFKEKQIKQVIGNEFNDPRRIYNDLASRNITGWIDTHQLTSAATESIGMFEQIAKGLSAAKLVFVFVSDEYSESDNCRMEFQFALKSLKKKVVPIIVGTGHKWHNTIIGMLVNGCQAEPIDMRNASNESYGSKMEEILKYCSDSTSTTHQTPVKERTYRAPTIGDHVICHHFKWAYFPATVAAFDKTTFEYTVDWDDGDPSGRQESYKNVALNAIPRQDEIAEGTIVFFPQGSYKGSEGVNTGGVRYHQGRVTKVHKNSAGEVLYDGVHTKGQEDTKWITYQAYSHTFTGMGLKDLRTAPNAMDALMAIEQQARDM